MSLHSSYDLKLTCVTFGPKRRPPTTNIASNCICMFSGATIARKKHKDKTDIRQYLKRSFRKICMNRIEIRLLV